MLDDTGSTGDSTFGGIFAPRPIPQGESEASDSSDYSFPDLMPDPAVLAGLSPAELEGLMADLLAGLRGVEVAEVLAGTPHEDGSLRVQSLESVWLIMRIGRALGGATSLVDLRLLEDVEVLRSLRGVAGLVADSIANREEAA